MATTNCKLVTFQQKRLQALDLSAEHEQGVKEEKDQKKNSGQALTN